MHEPSADEKALKVSGNSGDDAEEDGGAGAPHATSVAKILEQAKAALENKKGASAKHASKRKKDESSNGTETESSSDSDKGVMKWYAAKKPAKAVGKPAKAVAASDPPKPTKTPTVYRGGKIYYSGKKHKLRVYLRKKDKVEVTIPKGGDTILEPHSSGFKKAWRQALAAIDKDKRPHE